MSEQASWWTWLHSYLQRNKKLLPLRSVQVGSYRAPSLTRQPWQSGVTADPTAAGHMKRLHIQEVGEIVAAWENGTPLKSLCGWERVTTAEEHDRIYKTAPVCKTCDRIAHAAASRGEANLPDGRKAAAEIRWRVMSSRPVYSVSFEIRDDQTITWMPEGGNGKPYRWPLAG